MPHTWFLVPGYGSQGGTAKDVAAAFDSRGHGAIVNNSRGIIFAYRDEPYAGRFGVARWEAAVEAATRDMIERLRADTPAGRLDEGDGNGRRRGWMNSESFRIPVPSPFRLPLTPRP